MILTDSLRQDAIHVKDVRIWAHVGVLEKERIAGQWFSIDFSLWMNLEKVSKEDNIAYSADYSMAIKILQNLSQQLKCLTIECFSEQILDCLEGIYGSLAMRVIVRKCNVPVDGFYGSVAVERYRNYPICLDQKE